MKIVPALLLIGGLSCAFAETPSTSPPPSIRVSADAVAFGKPDRAQIDVGVLSQERQSQSAQTQNAKQMDAVMVALRRVVGADADIKTVNAALSPVYQYRGNGSQPPVGGYTQIDVVRVTVDDLSKVGAVIDAATQAGANHVESVQYMVKDAQPLRAQALKEAAAKARSDAEALASALGVRIVRILSAEETAGNAAAGGETILGDSRGGGMGDGGGPSFPTGALAIPASVVLTVEVAASRPGA